MTGGRRRIREFRGKRETAHLTRFKRSGTSRLPSETRRRPFIRCPGGGSSISSSFYQFFLKHQLFRTPRRPQRRLQSRRRLPKRCLHIGSGEKAAGWSRLAAEGGGGGVLRSDTSLPLQIGSCCPSPTSGLFIEASQTKRAAVAPLAPRWDPNSGYVEAGVAPPEAETM